MPGPKPPPVALSEAAQAELETLAKNYFDERGEMYPHAYLDFEHFLEKPGPFSPIYVAMRMRWNLFYNNVKTKVASAV